MDYGSIVECTVDFTEFEKWAEAKQLGLDINIPLKDKTYTVRDILHYENNIVGILLEEVDNRHLLKICPGTEFSFSIEYFRELLPPMEIDFEEIIFGESELVIIK